MQGGSRRAGSSDLTRVDGPPVTRKVVCLHGLGRSPSDWGGVRDGLGRFGKVVTPSLPRSPERALAVADEAIAPGSIVIGHSFGGVLALRLARDRARPLAALVLTDCFFPPARNGRTTLATLSDYGAHRIAYLRGLRGRSGAPLEGSSRSGGLAALGARPGRTPRPRHGARTLAGRGRAVPFLGDLELHGIAGGPLLRL